MPDLSIHPLPAVEAGAAQRYQLLVGLADPARHVLRSALRNLTSALHSAVKELSERVDIDTYTTVLVAWAELRGFIAAALDQDDSPYLKLVARDPELASLVNQSLTRATAALDRAFLPLLGSGFTTVTEALYGATMPPIVLTKQLIERHREATRPSRAA